MTNPIYHFSTSLRVMNAPSLHDEIETQTGLVPAESQKNDNIRNTKTDSNVIMLVTPGENPQ